MRDNTFIPPDIIVQNTIQAMRHKGKQTFLYTDSDLAIYENLFLKELNSFSLPMVTVYEIKAESDTGITVGYCFYPHSKKITHTYTFFLVSKISRGSLDLQELVSKGTVLNLIYKMKNLKFFVINGEAALITCGANPSLKTALEF